ncbi:hypothetical protein A3G14_00100 [Candidatus Curtissbacteria bacterium RIFCSPLOWO2_12_FULL_38_9]|uniref:SGNH hydrolase-type esterase domain-containing protein n=1 Tax=Candidatus Curtissbacteria bacterium RIFCSPLOWO2_12_FULL_38_9 TaxID=1797735 RepID=A0A1F5I7V2_9BACT|nr:MAG: hypothetical protein A3G14_00100 [Candidatus Curtissbacteria bacterium RIFCSPLOWO2_12_FULL_38_9]
MYPRIAFFFKDFSLYLIVDLIAVLVFISSVFFLVKSKYALNVKKITIAVIFSLVSTALIFSIFEGYFRYIYDESDGLGFLQVNKRWQERHVVYNNFFKRDRDFKVEKSAGTVRVGVLGDSITFGAGIADPKDRFSDILQKDFRQNGINAEIYNLGVPGLDSHEEIKLYQDLSYLNFDIIVWQYFLNDIQPEDKGGPAKIISQDAYSSDLMSVLNKNSTFFDFLYWRFSSKYATTFDQLGSHYLQMYSDESILKSHEEELSKFIGELKEKDKKIIVIIFPFIELIGPDYPANYVHDEMKSFFNSHDIEVVDLLSDLKDSNWKKLVASKFDTHPNEKVHKLAAEKLYEKLYPELK